MGDRLLKSQMFLNGINFQREFACRSNKRRKCSSLSSTPRGLFTLNSFHKVKKFNEVFYMEVLKRLPEDELRKMPELAPMI
jgi:hypothetical protein